MYKKTKEDLNIIKKLLLKVNEKGTDIIKRERLEALCLYNIEEYDKDLKDKIEELQKIVDKDRLWRLI